MKIRSVTKTALSKVEVVDDGNVTVYYHIEGKWYYGRIIKATDSGPDVEVLRRSSAEKEVELSGLLHGFLKGIDQHYQSHIEG